MYDQEKKKSRGEWWRMYITNCQLKWKFCCVSYMQIVHVGCSVGRVVDQEGGVISWQGH